MKHANDLQHCVINLIKYEFIAMFLVIKDNEHLMIIKQSKQIE